MPPKPLDYQSPNHETDGRTCLHCSGVTLCHGTLRAEGKARFFPDTVKSFWTYNDGVAVACHVCVTCGAMGFAVETQDRARLLKLLGLHGDGGETAP